MAMKYKDYLGVDESYFPCIDEEAINAGADWQNTYPHETFLKLLDETVKMLDGGTKRSLWIYGAYGTGKSQCAYALRKILDSKTPEEEVIKYWDRYDPLRSRSNLLEKIRGHREKKIVTVFRYAVSTTSGIETFFTDIQESIRKALIDNNCPYLGQNTQKDSAIKWLEEADCNKAYINARLKEPKWNTLFAESSADDILSTLKSGGSVTSLMEHLSKLSEETRISAFKLDTDGLVDWIKDVINVNNIKIVFVWDEFSDFFKRYSGYIAEFQKIVQICQSTPFYFVIVTHPISSLVGIEDESNKIVQQRFTAIEIQLPDTVAFDLIGDAIKVEAGAKNTWENVSKDLMDGVCNSTEAICMSINIKEDVIRKMLPIHPMTALALKNIATAFQSNQRSMFDFIKSNTKDSDEQSFLWYIKKYGPDDSLDMLLTVDMLWDYFYERGKQYLSTDTRSILDVYYLQGDLREEEKRVLKTILILNAISVRLGDALDILRPTEKNISNCYEGVDRFETIAKNIAKGLVEKGILIYRKTGDGGYEYRVAVNAGDNDRIEQDKKELRKKTTTDDLVKEGDKISEAIELSPALKLRFADDVNSGALKVVTQKTFIGVIDDMFRKQYTYNFRCVLAVAKDDAEGMNFRNLIKETVRKDKYRGLIVIDAIYAPFGMKNMEDYVDFLAMAQYYQGNNGQQARKYAKKAKDVLNVTWKKSIHDCQFILFNNDFQDGNRCYWPELIAVLENIVKDQFPNVLDFNSKLSESQLKASQFRKSARCGLDKVATGELKNCDEILLCKVWDVDNYWSKSKLQNQSVVKIKNGVDEYIRDRFDQDGIAEIGDIYLYLQTEQGFSPCNMSAFIFGFLLREYSVEPYRFRNSDGKTEPMSSEKMAEMIDSCMKPNHKDMYIVKMTPEEKDFYDVTEQIWSAPATQCVSTSSAEHLICEKIRNLGYPIWCLEESNDVSACELLDLYIKFIKATGQDQYRLALEIGRMARSRPAYVDRLHDILTEDSCKSAMEIFLNSYKDRRLLNLAEEISAGELLYADIRDIFSGREYSALWDKDTGLKEIDNLIAKYSVIKESNDILGAPHSNKIEDVCAAWRNKFKFMGLSCDGMKSLYPELDGVLTLLHQTIESPSFFSEKIPEIDEELAEHRDALKRIVGDSLSVFRDLYKECLVDFADVEVEEIRKAIREDLFPLTKTQSISIVSATAKNYSSSLSRNKLKDMWAHMTNSKSPIDWSNIHQTPILCVVNPLLFDDFKTVFETINSVVQSKNIDNTDIDRAIEFLENNSNLFDSMRDRNFVDRCFKDNIIVEYSALLPDLNFVRDKISGLGIDAYNWYNNPQINSFVESLARDKYENGAREKILRDVDNMSDSELKAKVRDLVSSDMKFGLIFMKDGSR